MGLGKRQAIEEALEAGAIAEAAEELFIEPSRSKKILAGFSKEERKEIKLQADVMSDDFDAGDLPGWRD